VERFLNLDPSKRLTAKDALDSDYFWEEPLPCKPGDLPRYEPSHEFQTRKRRQEGKLQEDAKRQQLSQAPPQAAPSAAYGHVKYGGYRSSTQLSGWAAPSAGGMTAKWAQAKKEGE
tara:strand:- start:65530 stop:65877 length:348 start_codon:yes stop_codon:yes gene_type:complete